MTRPIVRLCLFIVLSVLVPVAHAGERDAASAQRPKRLLLLGQGPDGHPYSTHEYMAGMHLLAKLLQKTEGLQTIVVKADEPWKEGPELLDSADGVVLFLSQGAKWMHQDAERLAAFQRFAERGGALAVVHWGMGTKEAEYIEKFVKLFGGCHGGPDRKFKIVDVTAAAVEGHPVTQGIGEFRVHEEFYYQLKTPKDAEITPLIKVPIDGETQTVGWAWERPDGGRSFGFSGGHYHRNWLLPEYRRLVAQGVLWTLGKPIPQEGLDVDVREEDLKLPPRPENEDQE